MLRISVVRAARGQPEVCRNSSRGPLAAARDAIQVVIVQVAEQTKSPGGSVKASDNLVVDKSPNGSVTVRFRPVPAARTEYCVSELLDRYQEAIVATRHHRVLLVGLLILDLLTIHPLTDGNGRVARALINALLADCDFRVGTYISLEQFVAESADAYYQSVLDSTAGLALADKRPLALAGVLRGPPGSRVLEVQRRYR